ncbi:hypothetical protein BST61_g4670 [Cercospora zeina]
MAEAQATIQISAPAQHRAAQPVKRRAACDECSVSTRTYRLGTKKLKCSGALGEPPRCTRCERENIACVFSPQKQMGRPKKRQGDGPGNRTHAKRRDREHILGIDISQSIPDVDVYESAFTPGGSLQPWLRDGWPADASEDCGHNGHGSNGGGSELTPDTGMYSSRSSSLGNGQSSSGVNENMSALLDPTLAGILDASTNVQASSIPKCACLSTLYLTLNNLQAMDNDKCRFPFSLQPLREAMQAASDVLRCEECPRRFISAVQNTQLLGALLTSIVERFSKVLEHINAETRRAQAAGESKNFTLADLNTSTLHLHTGGLDCSAAFSIELSPDEWRKISKRVVRAEVHGPGAGNNCCPYFVGLCEEMECRQDRWHSRPLPKDFPCNGNGLAIGIERDLMKSDHDNHEYLCLKMVGFARRLVAMLDWS